MKHKTREFKSPFGGSYLYRYSRTNYIKLVIIQLNSIKCIARRYYVKFI